MQPVCVVTEKNRIDVTLKNLAFGHFLFQHCGVSRLQHLVPSISIEARKEFVFDNLLRDGRSALARRTGLVVGEKRSYRRAQVDTLVVVETSVFNRKQRCDYVFRYGVDRCSLRILNLENTDLLTVDVVQHAALGKA